MLSSQDDAYRLLTSGLLSVRVISELYWPRVGALAPPAQNLVDADTLPACLRSALQTYDTQFASAQNQERRLVYKHSVPFI